MILQISAQTNVNQPWKPFNSSGVTKKLKTKN